MKKLAVALLAGGLFVIIIVATTLCAPEKKDYSSYSTYLSPLEPMDKASCLLSPGEEMLLRLWPNQVRAMSSEELAHFTEVAEPVEIQINALVVVDSSGHPLQKYVGADIAWVYERESVDSDYGIARYQIEYEYKVTRNVAETRLEPDTPLPDDLSDSFSLDLIEFRVSGVIVSHSC